MNIALVTYEDAGKYPGEGSIEDSKLKEFLKAKGLNVTYETWTNPAVNWENYDLVILKSPWDYFDRIAEFRTWLDLLDAKKVKVLNPTKVVLWNSNKQYLLDIENAGLAIVPTKFIAQGTKFVAAPFFAKWACKNIIVKPAISGGAKNTFSIPFEEAATYELQISKLLQHEDFLVQPFVPEVQTQGEWSLVFFNGNFSHCVLKVPKSGDFRVQHYFGGAIIPQTPPEHVLQYAQELIQQFAPGCLYARVDGLEINGNFHLMELELIEPLLYMLNKKSLYENYYQALLQLI